MNRYESEFLDYLKRLRNYSDHTVLNYKRDIDLSDAVNEWRERWLYKRIIYLKNTQQND